MLRRLSLLTAALALSGCVQATLAWTDMKPDGPTAAPALRYQSVAEWEAKGAQEAREKLQRSEYGMLPEQSSSRIVSRKLLDDAAFGGKGRLEELVLSASMTYGDRTVETKSVMESGGAFIHLITPAEGDGPFPVILMETFCPWWDVVPHPAVARPADADKSGGGVMGGVATYVFGRYICSPPIETILDAGYAIAVVFPGAIVPDDREQGLAELRRLTAGHVDDETRLGAIGAWGWAFSRVIDVLEEDPRFDRDAMIVWGHSRYAKAALIAAAFDPRIDGVIAHQSGTGGASLNFQKKGESIKSITANYPHWFARVYAEDNLEGYDQHMLLALIAPRPILLGNARRDVWSDPNGGFRAAIGADPVYELYGVRGLDQARLKPYDPAAEIAFWIRPGTHGVVKEDWPAFLEFLNAHFAPKDEPRGGGIVSAGHD